MGSKIFIFMCLLLVFTLHISAGVGARNLAETTIDRKGGKIDTDTNANGTHIECLDGCGDDNYGGYNGGGYHGGGGNNGGDNCRYGCCGGRNYYGVGCTCCSSAAEAAQARVKPHN